MSNSPRLGVQLVPDGAMDLDQPFNNLARQLDQVLNVRVLSATTAAQPGAPASGALYILPAGPTGASWAGKAAGTLALFDSGTWYFSTPTGFIVAHVVDTGAVLAWSGAAWVNHETLLGAKGTDVAAAATVTLANATGDYVHVTGATTITSFGTAKAGLERTLVHDAAHTLTHGANIINLTGANVLTAAGDISKWRSEGGTVWRMVGYVRANGLSLGAAADGAVVHLAGAETITGAKTFASVLVVDSAGNPGAAGSASMLIQGDANKERFEMRSAATGDPTFQGKTAGGTIGAPTATASGEVLAQFGGCGHDGTDWVLGNKALIRMVASENWTPTLQGAHFRFATTAAGSTTMVDRWSVNELGMIPAADNAYTVGNASFRVSEFFGAVGSINTSDARIKTEVRPFTQNELKAALALADETGFFSFLASIEKKGQLAREHCGMTVQRAIEVMEEHGLDPLRYGFICHDAWEAQYVPPIREPAYTGEVIDTGAVDENGEAITEREVEMRDVTPGYWRAAGDLYSFRPDQLDRFIARGIREEQKRLAARIAVLEAR